MATKPRHRKTEMQLWVVDNRKRLDLESSDLAAATGVSIDTARGWESRGRPSEDAIEKLERLFGRPAPVEEGQSGDPALAAAIRALTDELQEMRRERGRVADLELTVAGLTERLLVVEREALRAPVPPRVEAGSGR